MAYNPEAKKATIEKPPKDNETLQRLAKAHEKVDKQVERVKWNPTQLREAEKQKSGTLSDLFINKGTVNFKGNYLAARFIGLGDFHDIESNYIKVTTPQGKEYYGYRSDHCKFSTAERHGFIDPTKSPPYLAIVNGSQFEEIDATEYQTQRGEAQPEKRSDTTENNWNNYLQNREVKYAKFKTNHELYLATQKTIERETTIEGQITAAETASRHNNLNKKQQKNLDQWIAQARETYDNIPPAFQNVPDLFNQPLENLVGIIAHHHFHNAKDRAIFKAQMMRESNLNIFAFSNAGAQGIAQFISGTAQENGLTNRLNPLASLDASAQLMRKYIKQYGKAGALIAYNAGPGRVKNFKNLGLKEINTALTTGQGELPPETVNYLASIAKKSRVENLA